MLEGNTQAELTTQTAVPASETRQRRQMLMALLVLLIALVWVGVRDRVFWSRFLFPSTPAAEVESDDASLGQPGSGSLTYHAPKTETVRPKPRTAPPPEQTAEAPPAVVNRAVLPPLEIEVVAGDSHQAVHPGNPAVQIDMQPRTSGTSAGSDVTSASERASLSRNTPAVVTHSVQPDYPLLAKQMKVQGSVLLQALIGKDGNIQDLHVLSGPTILSEAARQAVRQWRFKPYLQSGQPVETEARITVNFTISTF
jgi:TonB family protein